MDHFNNILSDFFSPGIVSCIIDGNKTLNGVYGLKNIGLT
jgi:hypothetical protein